MSTANASSSPGATTNTPDRDRAADSDDSLARKRQRLSEEAEVRIEADEPEDMDDDLNNVIVIEDGLDNDAYSSTFDVLRNIGRHVSPLQELEILQSQVAGDVYLDPDVVSSFAAWLKQHLAETAHDKSRWQLKYLADAEFFEALARFSHSIFQYTDLFDPAIPSHPIQRIVHEFYTALTMFCIRMVSIIPKMLEEPLTRRDSVQPTGTGQERVPFSYYLNVLDQVLDPYNNSFAKMLQNNFGVKAFADAENVARLLLSQDPAIASLNAILLSLSTRPRAFTDAWHVIAKTISVMSRTLRFADTEYHAGDGRTQVDKMYMTIGEYVVPAVCQKHPRALPREFHNHLTKHVSGTLEITVMRRPMASVLDLYRAITQGDHALSCGIVDEPATELKLNEACRNDRATLAELIKDLWLLQVLKGYVSTDILDIKSKGIVTLRGLLKHSYNTHHTKGSDHPVLQYLARFLRIGNYTEYIFSADSHASLVKECSDVVGFLAATGTYTDHETDLIWRACTTSVEAEFVKASFEVLTAMLTYVRPPQVLHMARKFAQTQASALGPYAVTFLGEAFAHFKLTNKNSEMRLAPMRIAFDILKRLDLDAPAPTTSALRHVALRQIHALKDPPHGLDQREILYAMCVSEIKRRTKHATSSMEIFATFLSKPGQEEAGHILDLLPVRLALDELVHVVRGDVKDQEGGSHTTLDSVRIHLELVIRLIGLSEFAEDKELEERLWVHTIGDAAISSLAREHALDCFISTPQHTKNPSSVEKLFLRGVDQFLPTMSVDCATLRLVAFLHSKVKEAAMALLLEDLESILEDQSWQQLLRLATTTPSDGIAAAGLSSINDILFPGHIPRDNPHAIALQAAFVRRHIDSLQSLQSLQEDQDTARRRISINRGITLLETVLRHSKAFQPKVIGDVHPIELAGSEAADRIEFTVHIHGPQGSPIARTVQALEDCHLSDLGKALQSTSGVANHDLVLNGSLARFEDISSRTLHEAGIKSSSVVSIRPRYTFDCDFSKVFASTSAVESEIRARFGLLESLLDGPHEVTERVYRFLSAVSPPMSTRRHVLSHEVTLEDIFPPKRPWRTMYSIYVLTSHLNECNKLGVADQSFILHGVKVLAGLLMDPEPTSGLLLSTCLSSLLNFLQERPHPSPPPPYIEEPKKLALRLFDIIDEIQMLPFPAPVAPPSMFMHAELTKLAYCVILQLARTDGLWPEIKGEERFVSAHKTILLSNYASVSRAMAPVMCEFVKEKPELATGPYLRTLVALLPDAMSRESNTAGFFLLFRELLMADRRASDSDKNLRAIIETLVQQMWQYRHTETPDNAIGDATFLELLFSLNCAINLLKRFGQPLRLGDLAKGIFSRLLFSDADSLDVDAQTDNPGLSTANLVLRSNDTHCDDVSSPESRPTRIQSIVRSDSTHTPLYHVQSRLVCMEMVRMLCDNAEIYQWLVDRLSHVLEHGPLYSVGFFPTNHFIRAPEACSGLSNLGMTCYMNSLLQQIFSNIHFRHFIFETSTASSEPDLLWHVKQLFAEMQDSNVQVVDTQALAKYLNISVDNQEDVHGFYTIFMSALEQCLPDSTARSTFNRMFSGRLATQVQGSCGHVSSRTEPFSDLSITVQNKASLADSLAEFVQGEPMQGANKYKCLSCDAESGGKLVDAMRRTCLDDVPDHLNVCLKRFTFDMMGQESKNNDFFEFPEEIDLSKYERKSLENPNVPAQPDMFKLVGVIVHSGILTFGHYWSYVRLRYPNARVSKWVRLEDGNTRTASGFEEVQQECFGGHNRNHNGYVLFYQRESSFAKSSGLMADLPQGIPLQVGLPPRVQPPDDLYQTIHQDNAERHRVAQPFDEGFFKLITDLMGEFPLRSPSHGTEVAQSPRAGSEAMNREQGNAPDETPMCDSLARLAFDFLGQVLLRERVQNKMLQFVTSFRSLAEQNTKLARCFTARVSDNPDFFLRILDHDEYETRHSARCLLKDCLFSIKEPEPEIYAPELRKFVKAHASLLDVMGPRYQNWFDYFSMAYDVKFNGTLEMHVVLHAGYIPWILEVAMDVPLNPLAHPGQHVLFEAYRKKRVEFWPLFQFLQLFMEQGEAFKDLDHFAPGRFWHPARAVIELTGRSDAPRLTWMLLAARDNCEPPTPQINTSARLVHEMAGYDQRFCPVLVTSLTSILRTESSVSNTVFPMAASLIVAMGDNQMSAHVLRELIDAMKQSARLPSYKLALDTFRAIVGDAPLTVLESVPLWAPEWLLPEYKVPKGTQKWLYNNLFAPTSLNEIPGDRKVFGTAQDILRSRVVRQLSRRCKDVVITAHDLDDGMSYPQMNVVLEESFQYLTNLTAMCASIAEEAWRLGEQQRLRAERAIMSESESAEVDDEDQTTPAPVIPKLSDGMRTEYRLAREAHQELGSVLQELQSPWLEDDEQVEDEGDSSAFEETEDEA